MCVYICLFVYLYGKKRLSYPHPQGWVVAGGNSLVLPDYSFLDVTVPSLPMQYRHSKLFAFVNFLLISLGVQQGFYNDTSYLQQILTSLSICL